MALAERNREVVKPRLIAALLAELDASWAMVLAESISTGAVFHRTIQCGFKVPFEDTEVIFDTVGDGSPALKCVSCYGGQRISFELIRVNGSRWKLPQKVVLSELRQDIRLAFADKMYSAELITSRGAVYGHAVDINRDYLAVDVDVAHHLSKDEAVRVIVRLVSTNFDVFYNRCSVATIKVSANGASRVILRLEKSFGGTPEQRRHARTIVESASLQIVGSPFDNSVGDASLVIQNISSGGMTVSLRKDSYSSRLIAGLILKSNDPDLSYLVVWVHADSVGLRPILADSQQIGKWHRYLDQIAPPKGRKSNVTRKELATLLTHSGLLKGSRRKTFGHDFGAHLLPSSSSDSLLLIQRRILADDSGLPVLHVNLKRYTESAWLFADGAAFTDKKGAFVEMLQACIVTTRSMMGSGGIFPRYLTFIWHHTVKASDEFAKNLSSQSETLIVDAAQVSIRALQDGGIDKEAHGLKLKELSLDNAKSRRDIAEQFSPALYEAFVGADGTHPVLNAELGKYGPYHRAQTKVLRFESGAALIVHRVFTHNVWSTTGVTNSVFVVVPSLLDAGQLRLGLSLVARDEIAFGTDDFLLVFDCLAEKSAGYASELPNPKIFSFLVQDLLINPSLVFKDDDEALVRRQNPKAV